MPIKRKIVPFVDDTDSIIMYEKVQIANDLYMNIADIVWDIQIDNCQKLIVLTYRY